MTNYAVQYRFDNSDEWHFWNFRGRVALASAPVLFATVSVARAAINDLGQPATDFRIVAITEVTE